MPHSTTKKTANIPVNAILSIPKSGSSGTILERCATVMGSRTMTVDQVREALHASEPETPWPGATFLTPFSSNAYLVTLLQNGMTSVVGPNGQLLQDSEQRPVKAHLFHRVERGTFRVATPRDIRQEVLSVYGAAV